ncbi:MAG TPA: FtsX-like permease family protein [Acidimicrobiales bacterium]|nr:FtsX-like permease family protein [Acidimicrobiales bacterium]
MGAGWGLSLRLAWRESRRRPGRTALVLLVVGLPVAVLAVALVVLRTATPTPAEARAADYGQADQVVSIGMDAADTYSGTPNAPAPGRDAALAAVRAAVPEGSHVVPVVTTYDATTRPDGHLWRVVVTDEPLGEPLLAGRYEVVRGRAPSGPGEAALTEEVLHAAGVGVGDEIELLRLGRLRVTGVVAGAALTGLDSQVMVGGPVDPLPWSPFTEPSRTTYFVDVPDGSAVVPAPLPEPFGPWWPPFDGTDEAAQLRNVVSVAYALGAVGLLLTSTVAAAAFAVSARRHLRLLGLLAANGVPPAGLRRVMVLQGVVTGAVAAACGLAVALVAAGALGPRLDGWAGRVLGPLDVRPLDLAAVGVLGVLATTLAAWLPSRTAARVPVLAALAGRRPQGRVHPAVPLVGLVVAGIGSLALAAYATAPADRGWGVGLASAVLVLAGGALCTPWLVARFEPLAGRLRGAPRVASRGLARNRLRTAAVATAIMAPAAVAAFGFTLVASERTRVADDRRMGDDQALVRQFDGEGDDSLVPDAAAMAAVRAALPGAVEAPLRLVAPPDTTGLQSLQVEVSEDGGVTWTWGSGNDIAVASPALLDALDAPARVAGIVDGDATVVALRPVADDLVVRAGDGTVGGPDGAVLFDRSDVVAVDGGREGDLLPAFVVSEGWVRAHGLATVDHGVLLRAPEPLTDRQTRALYQPESPQQGDAWIRHEVLGTPPPDDPVFDAALQGSSPASLDPLAAAAAGAVLVLTLAVVAVTMALNAAENRDERALLAALGASPRVQRATTAWQAVMLPLVGMAVGVPLGVACGVVTVVADDRGAGGVAVPWLLAVLLVAGVPAASGGAARLAAAAAGRLGRHRSADVAALAWD